MSLPRWDRRVGLLGALTGLSLACIIPPEGGSPRISRGESTPREPPVPAAGGGTFQLTWQDDFNKFDRSRWKLMTHSFPTNLATFSSANTRIEGGILYIDLKRASNDREKPYRGVEMRSIEALKYGKVEARASFAKGPGVVSSLVLIYTPWPADDWNELDFEYLGAFKDRIQTNAMVYTGPPVKGPVDHSVTPTSHEDMIHVPFDPSADFHDYAIEWTPAGVRYLVDGQLVRAWNKEAARLKRPQNILLTIWASSAEGWAGAVNESTAPTSAAFDWIRVYTWQPP